MSGMPGTAPPLLEVTNLSVSFPSEAGVVAAVRGLSYRVMPGEVLGIVGESGSGKSVSSLAVMGLLPRRDPATDAPITMAVCNFKGGVAKTTTSIHLGQYLALKGYRVLMLDLDAQARAAWICSKSCPSMRLIAQP